MGLNKTQEVCMAKGKVEQFRGRFIVDGDYAFIWLITELEEVIKKKLIGRENRRNPEPIRPIFDCENCLALREYRERMRNEEPLGGRSGKTEKFLEYWRQDRADAADRELGLQFRSDGHGLNVDESGQGLVVTGFCYALNAIYRKKIISKANCGEV
jgi:hypothetical protein